VNTRTLYETAEVRIKIYYIESGVDAF
jgi:hypothetical protein